MSVNLEMLSQTIIEVARQEDLVLRRVGKGIFLVPELAFVYAVGRELAIKPSRFSAQRRRYGSPRASFSILVARTWFSMAITPQASQSNSNAVISTLTSANAIFGNLRPSIQGTI
jgi:hypothetical protein